MIININDDFNLYKISNSGQCFRVRSLDEHTFRFITGMNTLDIRALTDSSDGGFFEISCSENEWCSVWSEYFDLNTKYKNIRSEISSDDTFLLNASEIGTGIRILKQDRFEMLISFIISQRKSIPAIKSSIEKICKLFGILIPGTDVYSFPTPQALSSATVDELSSCGLGYRTPYVLEAAVKTATGEFDPEAVSALSDEVLVATLKTLRGVGSKVADCVALFGYHRIARAPVDTWIAKIIEEIYNGVSPFGKYNGYAGIMQQYMFYAAQHKKILKQTNSSDSGGRNE